MSVDDFDPEDPRRIHSPGPSPTDAQSAGPGLRFAARLVDNLIVLVFAVVVAVLIGAARSLYVIIAVSGLAAFVYFVAFETTRGWTPGKKLTGLLVCGPGDAPKPTVQQSAVRNAFTLLVILPFVGGLLGLTACILIASTIGASPTQQGIHDRWAGGTRVLRNRP
ncbi:putative membrane protein/domain protein [Mycolicibacterium rhodesiae NBB3]|uniref:Putative membrane protein/domain protein n=1 Tax=Mycolicibacterium rhodesiae (strain NBB3) TaxID=710685 RepID=G8RKG5_MYCRN|nr:RDD family protein [Mycolicibacterium rhodesiae]AEV73567.1 putative membrane protein/domain protein [Mycolicibacterium rhodesiae NBB3]